MFTQLQSEITERFRMIEDHRKYSVRSPADIAQTSRGLSFVEVYAVYEYTLRTATRNAVTEIAAHSHRLNRIKPSLLALFLDAELESLRKTADKNEWLKRLTLLEKAFSRGTIAEVVARPHDGSHFRYSQLQMTFDVFGITRKITARPRQKFTIDEVVENRNRIAHGDETPAEIGRRYSTADVKKRIQTMHSVCERIIMLMSEHCAQPARHLR